MKYRNCQNTLLLHMIYAGFYKAGREWSYKKVISPFTRIYLIEKGEAKLYMNRRKYELKEGDLFIVPKFTFHEYECEDFIDHYYICFLDQFLGGKNIFEYTDIKYKLKASVFDKYLVQRFIELNPNCQITDPDPKAYDNKPDIFTKNREKSESEFKNDIESRGILLQLFSRFLIHSQLTHIKEDKYKRMSNVFNYINNNLDKKIYVTELSEIMCVNPDYFTRLFKNINGMTPNQYIQQKRIERAQTLMISSSMSIKEIAEEMGIPNLSQFSKLFYKHTGMNPSNYMKNEMS